MSNGEARVSDALVAFASQGHFPDDESIAGASVESSVLPAAYQALDAARTDLEAEIRSISRETATNVSDWMAQAQALQADIEKSRKLAGEIVKQAEADEERIHALEDHEAHLAFLEKEKLFNTQLYEALQSIKHVHQLLDETERLASERHILEALQTLAESWQALSAIPASKSTRVVRLLESRALELQTSIHEQFLHIWRALVHFDSDHGSLVINQTIEGEFMNLDQAIIVLQSYKEVPKAAKEFWQDFDHIILKPRAELSSPLFKLKLQDDSIRVDGAVNDTNTRSLLRDLEGIVEMLNKNLPPSFVQPLAEAMMPELSRRITEDWLEKSVPSSLDDMVDYQKTLSHVDDFTSKLSALDWPGLSPFKDWVSDAPKIWLSKRRETALDWIRNQLSLGVGEPLPAQHVESRMVARDEGLHIATTGNVVTQDWDAAWDSDEAIDPASQKEPTTPQKAPPPMGSKSNRGSLDEAKRYSAVTPPGGSPTVGDDEADAWGWGDDDVVIEHTDHSDPVAADNLEPKLSPETREVTLSEAYYTSSMPKPLLDLIMNIYNDAAHLTKEENERVPVAIAATGLFALPTLILAMYRAVSPFHYSRNPSGNMYAYNDSMWLCDRFKEYAVEWEGRTDLPARAYGKVKLDPEIRALQSFGKRAYTNEMIAQRTVINDLMGGAQNFLQGALKDELAQGIRPVVAYIREKAAMWKKILPYSAWASAVGSLVNAVATKIINDVFDLSGMDVDEAEQTAQLINTVSELDDCFIPDGTSNASNNNEAAIPLTAQFANNWMKMKFLSEVLQANLVDIRYLWFKSDLSLYFTKEEATDLIKLSFEDNVNSRKLIGEIKQS